MIMSNSHSNDISIGPEHWISVEKTTISGELIELDPLMNALLPMWHALEKECVAACCGIDAFGLWPEDVLEHTAHLPKAELHHQLSSLINNIEQQPDANYYSRILNNCFNRATLLLLLQHLQAIYQQQV